MKSYTPENEKADDQNDTSIGRASAVHDLPNPARRRFGAAGLAASGIIATLASRPVLGAGLACKSPSGFLSGNLSTHGEQPICAGKGPGYWRTNESWPIANRETAQFGKVFQCNAGSPYAKVTFLQLLEAQTFDKHKLGMHLSAAFLNATAGYTPFLPVERILSIFNEWQRTGQFSPTAAVYWDSEQIVEYLDATQA